MIVKKKLSSKDTRFLVNNLKRQSELDTLNTKYEHHDRYEEIRKIERSLAKSILILRIAMNRIGEVIGENENNWVVHESLMEEKNALHSQIDSALKKKKLVKIMSDNSTLRFSN